MTKLILIGAGGAGLEALLVARRAGIWCVLGFADDNASLHLQTIEGVTVLGGIESVLQEYGGTTVSFHCAVGRNSTRKLITERFEAKGFRPATLIDPSSVLAPSAAVGAGSYVGPHVFIGPFASVGRHCLINTGSSIGHHTSVGDYSQVCPGVRLSGHTTLSEGVFVGSNGVTVPGVKIGAWTTLGASSLALRDIPPNATAIGVPAKVLASPSPGT
jgi:acetyltransferase EpsM